MADSQDIPQRGIMKCIDMLCGLLTLQLCFVNIVLNS